MLIIFPMLKPVEDIYLFGGKSRNEDSILMASNEIHKLSIGQWDVTGQTKAYKVMNHSSDSQFIIRLFIQHVSHCAFPAKMKWKVPLYIGIPPARRHGHIAFIFHSQVSLPQNKYVSYLYFHSLWDIHFLRVCFFVLQLFVFGGKNEEQEFNDLKVMKLINPSERQPGILSFIFLSHINQRPEVI